MSDSSISAHPPLPMDSSRRTAIGLTCAVGAVGTVALAVPFVSSFAPSERAKAAGAPVDVDLSTLKPGELRSVEWRGKPVWVLNRTKAMLASLNETQDLVADPDSQRPGSFPNPPYAENQWRSIKPEYLVLIGICTHLGCVPIEKLATGGGDASLPADWHGGFLCPCHGSLFDLAGRVYKNKPAPDNLQVPPYEYTSDTHLLIGVDEANKA